MEDGPTSACRFESILNIFLSIFVSKVGPSQFLPNATRETLQPSSDPQEERYLISRISNV